MRRNEQLPPYIRNLDLKFPILNPDLCLWLALLELVTAIWCVFSCTRSANRVTNPIMGALILACSLSLHLQLPYGFGSLALLFNLFAAFAALPFFLPMSSQLLSSFRPISIVKPTVASNQSPLANSKSATPVMVYAQPGSSVTPIPTHPSQSHHYTMDYGLNQQSSPVPLPPYHSPIPESKV